jgi:SAM-dependent methyltransferase
MKGWLWWIYARVYNTVTTSYPYQDMMRQIATQISKGSRVLDVGCGTGGLLEYVEGIDEYIGIDSEPAMLELARQRFARLEGQNPGRVAKCARFIHASVYDLADVSPNMVVFCNSLYTLDRKLEALQKVHQFLAPGGRVLISDPDGVPDIRQVLEEHFEKYAKEHGTWSMRLHKAGVFPKLLVITVINYFIFDAFTFTRYAELSLILLKVGFFVSYHNRTYAGQNLFLLAFKKP